MSDQEHEHDEQQQQVNEEEREEHQVAENEPLEDNDNNEENNVEAEEERARRQREKTLSKRIKVLEEAYKLYTEEHTFKPGDFVVWKSDLLKNHSFLGNDRCGVVTRVLDEPVYDNVQKDAGSQNFREPLDIVVGMIDPEDAEFSEVYLDSRRMKPYDPSEEPEEAAPAAGDDEEARARAAKKREEMALLCSKLAELYALLTAPRERELEVGDPVRWKKGLANKKRPKADEPAVVVETLYERRKSFDPTLNANTQYFREPLDIKIAFVDKDGEFMIYHYDSRRFELVDDKDLQKYAQYLRKRRPKASTLAKVAANASTSSNSGGGGGANAHPFSSEESSSSSSSSLSSSSFSFSDDDDDDDD